MSLILDYWFLTPVSAAAATIATMVGIGGPVFFTPLFIFVLELPPATAVAAALFAQSFGFLSGTIAAYWRSRLIDRAHARHRGDANSVGFAYLRDPSDEFPRSLRLAV